MVPLIESASVNLSDVESLTEVNPNEETKEKDSTKNNSSRNFKSIDFIS